MTNTYISNAANQPDKNQGNTNQEGRGHRSVYYTSPQSQLDFLSRWLNNLEDF